jgi:hypothetical protein
VGVTTYATATYLTDNYVPDGYSMFVATESGALGIAQLKPAAGGGVGITHLL